MGGGDFADRAQRIHGRRGRRPQGGHDASRPQARRFIAQDGLLELFRDHGEGRIGIDKMQIFPAIPGDLDAFFDAGMGLSGGIDDQAAFEAPFVGFEAGGLLPGRDQGAEGGRGSAILDDAL